MTNACSLYPLATHAAPLPQAASGSVLWWATATFLVLTYPRTTHHWANAATKLMIGLLILLPAWQGLIWIKQGALGNWQIMAVMVLVWGADVGAYFSGRAFGKRKLAPKVSPGKSWEGVWGGMAGVVVLALLTGFVLHWTKFGRHVFAIGGNEQSAVLMGLPVGRTKVTVYAISGFCAALGGVVNSMYTLSGNPTAAGPRSRSVFSRSLYTTNRSRPSARCTRSRTLLTTASAARLYCTKPLALSATKREPAAVGRTTSRAFTQQAGPERVQRRDKGKHA